MKSSVGKVLSSYCDFYFYSALWCKTSLDLSITETQQFRINNGFNSTCGFYTLIPVINSLLLDIRVGTLFMDSLDYFLKHVDLKDLCRWSKDYT